MKKIIIELEENEFYRIEKAEKKNYLVEIREILQQVREKGRLNIVNV